MAIHNGNNVLARRLRMFRRDPHCYWCGLQTVLNGEGQPNHATIDHLYSKLHPLRPVYQNAGHDRSAVLHVLACAKCNGERGLADQVDRLFIPKLESRKEIAKLASAAVGNRTLDEYYQARTKKQLVATERMSKPQRALMPDDVRGFGWTDTKGDLRPRDWDEYCKRRPAFIGLAFRDAPPKLHLTRVTPICTLGELLAYKGMGL